MSDESTELTTSAAKPLIGSIPMNESGTGLQLRSFDDMYRFAQAVVKSKDFAPRGLDTPEKVMLAIQTGMELGFSLMRSLTAVIVVNGRPGLYGEAVLALVHDRKICSRPPVLSVEGDGDERRGVCRFQRKDMPEALETTFSVADAKKAKLWGKSGPWTDYMDDMLQWRAVARANKRYFSDVTLGLALREELDDYPAEPAPRSVAPPPEPDPLLVGVVETELVDSKPQRDFAAEIAAVKKALRETNTQAGHAQVVKNAQGLIADLAKEPADLLDDLNLSIESRLSEILEAK